MLRYLTPQGGCIKNIFRSIPQKYVDIACLKSTTKEGVEGWSLFIPLTKGLLGFIFLHKKCSFHFIGFFFHFFFS